MSNNGNNVTRLRENIVRGVDDIDVKINAEGRECRVNKDYH